MRRTLSFLLIFSLITPPLATPAPAVSVDVASEICQICGHECCCPEMCQAELKKQKEEKEAAARLCNQPLRSCRWSAEDSPVALTNKNKDELVFAPRFLKQLATLTQDPIFFAMASADIYFFSTPAFDVITPPPRAQKTFL